jgi:sugar (pentulose or hexulose) kinase
MYGDQRAVDEARAAQEAGAERWARLGLRIQPSFGLPKWAWLLRQDEGASSVARLAHAPDVVVERLVGGAAPTDWSHALKSGYDPERQEWATEVLDALGVPVELLPDVRRPTETIGRLSAEASDATGLPRACVVKLGMTDSCAAQLAAGAGVPGRFVSVLGSTLVLKGASRELVVDPGGAVYSHRHPDGWWLPGGASSTGARALPERFAGRDLAELDQRAARHGPARAVVYPLVGRGERFPFTVPEAEAFEIDGGRGEDDSYRAVLEGVAFVERLGFERLRALGATIEPPVAVAGGGSRSEVWNRIRATVLGLPVVAAPEATTARGACILAAAGTLHPDLATAMDAMAATGEEVKGLDDERDALDANYARFVSALCERGWWADGS